MDVKRTAYKTKMTAEIKKYNVTFLLDKNPPKNIILLKRAHTKSYAPDFYTGIGGKIGDLPGHEEETPLESAYRELSEETMGQLSEENIKLTEFARCIYNDGLTLYYFWGKYDDPNPPKFDPEDGSLVWVSTEELFDNKIIPTTEAVCKEWKKREFRTDVPFTVYLEHTGTEGSIRLVRTIITREGLRNG